ncbi:MAG: mechanosensitive ion channel family protein [Lachnospiraceae bacterium]|nr:mechanosensitive ion channel family protein [Lachnospiraceae bacterium]
MNMNSGLVFEIAGFLNEHLSAGPFVTHTLAGIIAVLLAAGITVFAIFLNHELFQRVLGQNELTKKFLKSLLDLLFIILGVVLGGIFFGSGRSMGRVLLGSTGLVVAIIGFAAQSALGDVIAGVMIGASRPFRLGDRIELQSSGISGTIQDMSIRHTVIHQFDGLYVIVPNSELNKEIIHNYSYHGELTGTYLEFDISYGSDVQKAMKIIHDAVASNRYAVEYPGDNPERKTAAVYVTGFMQSSVRLRTTVWARNSDDNFLACSAIRVRVKQEFERQGIEIPFNYLNVVMRGKTSPEEQEQVIAAGPVPDGQSVTVTVGEENEVLEGVFAQVESFCKKYRVSSKESMHIRMLSEEVMAILQSQTGSFDGRFWIDMKGHTAQIRVETETMLDERAKRKLMSVSGSPVKPTGMVDMIRSVYDDYRLGRRGSSSGIWSWKGSQQKSSAATKVADPVANLEKSIIETLADDVQISISDNKVQMIIFKRLWSLNK